MHNAQGRAKLGGNMQSSLFDTYQGLQYDFEILCDKAAKCTESERAELLRTCRSEFKDSLKYWIELIINTGVDDE